MLDELGVNCFCPSFVLVFVRNKYILDMSRVTIKDKTFETSIPEAEILKKVKQVADRINKDFEGKTPLFLAVLNGSFMYAADLMKHINIPCEISFVKLASYQGTTSTGTIKETLGTREPAGLHICTLLLKPGKLTVPLDIEYAAIEIPNDFIVGYGLDYDQEGRNLRDIYTLVKE